MLIDGINLNYIRIFECVFRAQSMTTAAKELHLTQSGVSQHIKSLESMLGVKLFDRIRQKLVPTSAASELYRHCSRSLTDIEKALWQIKGGEGQLTGTVAVGMPVEFGNNVVIPLLGEFCKRNPGVKLQLRLDFASVMNEQLLSGELDFAFVDDFAMDRRVETERVYDEVIELCIAQEALKRAGTPKHQRAFYESLRYVDYQEDAPVLKMWFAHHLGKNLNVDVRASVMDVQGIARLIASGLGAGALPGHLIPKLEASGMKLHLFKGCGRPLKNAISVAYLRDRSQSRAAAALLSELKAALRPH